MHEFNKGLTARQILYLLACVSFGEMFGVAANIQYVGNALVSEFRTTSVLKPLDADGDNMFGTAGYVFYGTDVLGNANAGAVVVGDPLTYSSGTIQTKLSLPPWLTLVNHGQNRVAVSFSSYPQIDDPAVASGPVVQDVQLGLAVRLPNAVGAEGSMVDVFFGSNAPASGIRIGVICLANTGDAIDVVCLASTFGGDSAIREGPAGVTIYLFDIDGPQTSDIVTLYLTKNVVTGGNANVAYVGLTFDVLPSNTPPKVNLIQPVGESIFAAPLNTFIKADVTDADGLVTNVTFYVNGVKFATDDDPPYSVPWNAVPAGTYSIFAVAADATGSLRHFQCCTSHGHKYAAQDLKQIAITRPNWQPEATHSHFYEASSRC